MIPNVNPNSRSKTRPKRGRKPLFEPANLKGALVRSSACSGWKEKFRRHCAEVLLVLSTPKKSFGMAANHLIARFATLHSRDPVCRRWRLAHQIKTRNQ
jgi:hypothetical protein